jgi:NitT/TauT family transport system substrate-binding protein
MKYLSRLILLCMPLLLAACDKTEPQKAPAPQAEEKKASTAPAVSAAAVKPSTPAGPALRIAYSDWPGWVAWDIAVQKGWFKEAGVEVDFKWFEYVPSMEAFSAGKVDAVTITNGDALVTGSSGSPSVGILINDYSNGNDMIVAKAGITKMEQLKGKKIGVEVGFVDHLLLMNALKAAGMTEKDIKIVNVPTDQTPQTLKSGAVDAIAAWQPNSGTALRENPGSTPIFTSANVPGIIYDVLSVNPKSLAERRADWLKVVKVWFKIADYLKDPKNLDEAASIMAARVGLKADEYKALMAGTFFLDAAGNTKHFAKGESLESIYGSNKIVDEFNVKNAVYKAPMKVEEYLDPSLVAEATKAP